MDDEKMIFLKLQEIKKTDPETYNYIVPFILGFITSHERAKKAEIIDFGQAAAIIENS